MSRFLLLFLFLIWMAGTPTRARIEWSELIENTATFLGGYVVLVLALAVWNRRLARRVRLRNASLQAYHLVILLARLIVLAWFAIGILVLDWGIVVRLILLPIDHWPIQAPGAMLATLPALLAWMGLWWAQYPAERAFRERNVLLQFDDEQPLTPPPTLRRYLLSNLRLGLLFTIVPILLILLVHDIISLSLWWAGLLSQTPDWVEALVSLTAALLVLVFAPEILRRVLHTQPLPDSPLRRRLEELCRRYRLRYRDILLWKTHSSMGNAAVMGLVPQLRYILLSDLLLETMTEPQIEAVFAHEVGHVVHRHMAWYVIFFMTIMLIGFGPAKYLDPYLDRIQLPFWLPMELLVTFGAVVVFLLGFGFLSRRFERQADVFAARAIQSSAPTAPEQSDQPVQALVPASHVGPHGATVFASALRRVAVINNIPLAPRRPPRRFVGKVVHMLDRLVEHLNNWLHGSIPSRMNYVHELSADPARTLRFDRFMTRLYASLLVAMLIGVAMVVLQ